MASATCNLLRSDLELYADGELTDSRRATRIRRHLDACAECREALARQDGAVRSVLCTEFPDARDDWLGTRGRVEVATPFVDPRVRRQGRAFAIGELIDREPVPSARAGWSSTRRWIPLAAALLIGAWIGFALRGDDRDRSRRAISGGGDAIDARNLVARGSPRDDDSLVPARPPYDLGFARWVPEGIPAHDRAPGRSTRFLGMVLGSDVVEFCLEAELAFAHQRRERWLFIPEDWFERRSGTERDTAPGDASGAAWIGAVPHAVRPARADDRWRAAPTARRYRAVPARAIELHFDRTLHPSGDWIPDVLAFPGYELLETELELPIPTQPVAWPEGGRS